MTVSVFVDGARSRTLRDEGMYHFFFVIIRMIS